MGLIGNLQDKLSGNKDPAVNASYTNQGANSSYQTHDNPTGGLTGSSHPTHGTTATSNNPLSSNAPHGSSGITGGSHPLVSGGNNTNTQTNPGYSSGEGSHLTGSTGQYSNTGLPGTQHSGPGLTGTSHAGGFTDSSHTGHGMGSNTYDNTSSGLAGGATHHNNHNTQGQRPVDFVPGSHPAANNHDAIPTAGGQKLGGVGDGVGHSSSRSGAHETMGDRAKNALPGQQGNAHDAYGNPINPSTTGPHTMSSHSSHPTGSHTTGSHTTSGVTGSNTAYNNQPGSAFSSSAQPLSHDPQFNDRHSGPGAGTGLAAGAVGGASHHNTHNTHNVGEDNRGMMDKAKDALSSKRSNQPDDPITGTNYDQKTRDQYTQSSHNQTTGTQGGLGTHQQHGSSGLTGSNTHNTHNTQNTHNTHSTGVVGTHQQHGSNTHNTQNTGVVGEDNRGMMDKAKDALSSKRSNQPDDPITGTNYDQKNRDQYTDGQHGSYNQTTGTHGGLASHQQHGSSGLAGQSTHNTHDTRNTHSTHNTHDTRNTHSTHNTGVVGEDNRGMMDKAKDTLSSKRSNQPDDPITGTNYDQKSRDQYTQGTHGSGLTSTSHGNTSHNQQAGVAGIAGGLGQTHLGSNTRSGNTHSGTHNSGVGHNASHSGRSAEWKDGYEAGYQEAIRSLNSGSHTGTHPSTTGVHSGSNVGSTGAYSSTTGSGYADHNKPTMGDKLNPRTDADRDGKVGIMD